MREDPVEAVGDRRARRAPAGKIRSEHEMIDEELGASTEEVRERSAPVIGLESIRLADAHPRQLLPAPRQLVALARERLLGLEQLEARREPLFPCPGLVLRHHSCLLR